MRNGRVTTGWDVLTALGVALALLRIAVEHDEYRDLVGTIGYTCAAISLAIGPRCLARRGRNVLNGVVLALIAGFPFVMQGRSVATLPGWPVYTLAGIAFAGVLAALHAYLRQAPDSRVESVYLPAPLHVRRLVPLTLGAIIVYGMALALPVGPLSDEGMALFMEGGCDWGESSVFFFAKLGLWIAVNACMAVALRERLVHRKGLAPHFLVAIALVGIWWNDHSCDRYYAHPQGNLAQMVVEISSLALLMLWALQVLTGRSVRARFLGLLAPNVWHVAAFYLALGVFAHWTWSHTALTAALTLLPVFGYVGANFLKKKSPEPDEVFAP